MSPIFNVFGVALLLSLVCTAILAILGYRPYVDEFSSIIRRAIAVVLFVGILAVAIFLPVASFGDVGKLALDELHVPDLLAGHVLLVVFLLLWWRLRRQGTLAQFLHLSLDDLWGDIGLGIKTGLSGWLITIMVMIAVVGLLGSTGAADDVNRVPEIMPWMARLPFFSKLAIVATAMTVEEAFFRSFLQSRIGWLASSILFALGHFSYGMPQMIAGVFTVSLVIGRTFAKGNRLLPCMIAHGIFDGIQIFVILPYAVGLMEQAGTIAS